MTAFWAGLQLGLGLIVAIGAQNAFVLRQGLRREHVFAVALFCAVSDAVLIAIGVSGFALASNAAPWLAPAMRWGGVAFLLWYGARAFRSAWRGGAGLVAATGAEPLGAVLATLAALTWANPHVWLDTVVLLGTISAQFAGREAWFAAGAMSGSVLFFFTLGYGARALAPLFARPRSWQVLDALIGVVMWAIALRLALD
ncbi:MAG: LysE/ArgO family amino acid transporter [Pseudorhodobacter sp.]|jgi:L-lysine exporter family protein LysE/ArgO|nr:LysE/ArgO family amino acid transporter [Pseudorhodobacter sp.]